MPQKMFTCARCDQSFPAGKWKGCFDDESRSHVVAPKTYYSNSDRLVVHVILERTVTDPQGKTRSVPSVFAEFHNGQYVTDSPEIQEVLDTKDYLQTKEVYIDSRLTVPQKMGRQAAKVEEQRQLIDRQQRELESLKAAKGKGKEAA